MARVLLVLAGVAVTIYALVDAVRADDANVRVMPKPYWVTLVILVPVLGALAWLTWGRPVPDQPNWWEDLARGRFGTRATPGRDSAPDDDPGFLAALDDPARKRGRRPTPPPSSGPPTHPDGLDGPGGARGRGETGPHNPRQSPGGGVERRSTGSGGSDRGQADGSHEPDDPGSGH
jgi:hypothetical protein